MGTLGHEKFADAPVAMPIAAFKDVDMIAADAGW